jgi:hypothetical protein
VSGPTEAQIAYLNRLLGLFRGDYRARVDPDDLDAVLVEDSAGLSHLYLARTGPGIFPPGWSVACTVVSGGSRDYPPDVDVYEAHPATRWEEACRNLLGSLLFDFVDALE